MLLSAIPGYFKARRETLAQANPGAAFIFPAAEELLRNPDVHHPFRQESNFYYLTGFEEPDAFLVIVPAKSKAGSHRTILFVRHRDPEKEMWEGERYGIEGAQSIFGADEAYTIDQFDKKLPELIAGAERVFYRVGLNESVDRRVLGALEVHRRGLGRVGKSLTALGDPNEALGELRLFKSAEEAALMRKACEVTALAHATAMREIRPGMKEFEIEALIEYVVRKHGCSRLAYGSIVAGGRSAACLHYRANNDTLRDGEMLLVDAGGEYGYYGADITRTFPVGRSFKPAQARVYDLVLRAQKECVAMTKPGVTLPQIHRRATEILTDGMIDLGFLQGKRDELIQNSAFRRFYPHGTGHWLGMDVHDVGMYTRDGAPRPLEPGMVFTVEPGFYVQPGDREVPAEYRDIGIRIEDDILVTRDGYENLTAGAPKERAEIEALRAQALGA